MSIKLVRFADDGFVNYIQNHSHTIRGPLIGCYAFIEKEEYELLSFKDEYLEFFPTLINRTNQQRHEIFAKEESLVHIKNIQITGSIDDIIMEKDSAYIPQELIIKSTMIHGQDFPLHPRMYVPVTLQYAKERLDRLKKMYHYIESIYQTKNISLNTQFSDYCECIVNLDLIQLERMEEN